MKPRSVIHKGIVKKTEAQNASTSKLPGVSGRAYGDKVSICINTDCMLRKKAGGCLGFEGCPGFKSR